MTIEVAFSADDNYAPHLCVALFSLLKNSSPSHFYQLHVLDGGIKQSSIEKIEVSLGQFTNFKLSFHRVDKKLFANAQKILHVNEASYFRILLPDILPTLQRILYLDCDLLILDDVAAIYQHQLKQAQVLACVQIFHPNYETVLFRQFPTDIDFCFNAGVMLLDLSKMRYQGVTAKLLDFASRNSAKLLAADQDVFNIVMAKQVCQLEPKWNVGSYIFYAKDQHDCGLSQQVFAQLKTKPSIIHFDGAKPWSFGNQHPYGKAYFALLAQTEFKSFRPSFNLSALIANSSFHYAAKIMSLLPRQIYDRLQKYYLQNNFLEKRYRETCQNSLTQSFYQPPLLIRIVRYLLRLIFSLTNLPYELSLRKKTILVKDNLETVRRILSGKSIARFGDGEFELMDGRAIPFQDADRRLREELRDLFNSNDANLLIGIPETFYNLNKFTFMEQIFWRIFMSRKRLFITSFLRSKTIYYSSFVTRPYLRYQDKQQATLVFKQWKKVWQNKKVLIVEGEGTRFGVNNDLLNNAKAVKRIITTDRNAFSKYDLLYQAILDHKEFEVVLLALGPTATVLVANLSKQNLQVIDVGHLDIEYEWYLRKAKKREIIPDKVILESNQFSVNHLSNKQYDAEILCKI